MRADAEEATPRLRVRAGQGPSRLPSAVETDDPGHTPPRVDATPGKAPSRRLLVLLVLLQGAAFAAGFMASARHWSAAGPFRRIPIGGLPEPSGLVLLPSGKSFLCVSDERWIAEIDLDGRVIDLLEYPDSDLEAVCLAADGESVLVIEERKLELLHFGWNPLRLLDVVSIKGRMNTADDNLGPEGLDLLPGGDLVLAVESAPASVLLLRPDGTSLEIFLDAPSVSEVVHLKGSGKYLLLSRERGLLVMDRDGRFSRDWLKLPGNSLEGLAIVPGRGLYVANDRDPGEFLLFSRFPDEESLLRALGP